MVRQVLILQGGEDVKNRVNETLVKRIGELSASKRIMVIPWTGDSTEKEAEYRPILTSYFSDNGFQEVLFVEKEDTETEISRKFSSVDVIYLPGGDPGILYQEIEKRSLQDRLRVFNGIILGNSAGAIVLSKGATHGERFFQGFGMADFLVSVHYDFEEDSFVENHDNTIVRIPSDMWIVVTGKNKNSPA